MARCVAMAFWITSVSSVVPSPLAPRSRRFTQVSGAAATRADRKRGRRQGGERSGVKEGLDPWSGPDVRIVEAVGEGLHQIRFCGGGEALAAIAQCGKDRHRAASDPSMLISLRGLLSTPKRKAGPETSSRQASLTQSSSA